MSLKDQSVRVLLIDDDEDDYVITRNLLRKIDGGSFDLEWDFSYLAAVETIKERRHDIYLIDYRLGEFNGVDLVRTVVESGANSLVIMLTGQGERGVDIEAMSAGAADFLEKGSITPSGLERSIRHARERKRSAEELRLSEERYRRLNETLEHQVAERTAELRLANKELEAFSYSVSHDLRAPLRAIHGFSHAVMEDCADRLDEESRGHLSQVLSASLEMSQLIDDMLHLARVTTGEMRHDMVDLTALTESVVADLKEQQPDRTVTLKIESGLNACGDRRLLKMMLTNLLGNAWKFTSKRPVAEISFGADQQDGQPVYFIRDNGAGFDMAHVSKLFEPFERLHKSEEFAGTGVGLATVQRVINRHGGRVWADGTVDGGASFYFTLAKYEPTCSGDDNPDRETGDVVRENRSVI